MADFSVGRVTEEDRGDKVFWKGRKDFRAAWMGNRKSGGDDTACIQVDYSRIRTFSVDYAIDLDKNGAKNNDCR